MSARSHYESKKRSQQRQRALARQGTGAQIGGIFEDLEYAVGNIRDVWPVVGEVYADRQDNIFATQSHGRWAPLRAATIIKKRSDMVRPETLIATGTMFKAVSSPTPRAQGDYFAVFGPPRGGPDISYAMHHALGRGTPQRNPVPRMTAPEIHNIVELIRDHFRPEGVPKKGRPLETHLEMKVG